MRKREMWWKLFNPKAMMDTQRELTRDFVNPMLTVTSAMVRRNGELQSRLLERCEEAVAETSEQGAGMVRPVASINSAVNKYVQHQLDKWKL